MENFNYYVNELKRINPNSEYPGSIKISDGEGNSTKYLSLNKESASIIAQWLLDSFNDESIKVQK